MTASIEKGWHLYSQYLPSDDGPIATEFTIKDLESFSGIKAHTIRIWEKRYNLFEPNRTDSNIRYYDIHNLQKLLNVALLNNNGLKISKIAELSDSKIAVEVRELVAKSGVNNQASNSLKLAMLNFDENMFNVTIPITTKK